MILSNIALEMLIRRLLLLVNVAWEHLLTGFMSNEARKIGFLRQFDVAQRGGGSRL
jgi:hypothetical protein